MIRGLGRRYPGLSRQVLELSANGFLPRGLFDHWLGQDIANVVFVDGIRLRWRSLSFRVPMKSYVHYREFEPATVCALERQLKPGMTFVDIGANIGYTAALAAQLVGQAGRVLAFEPSPRTVDLLRRNIADNRLTNVTIYPYAIGEAHRTRTFWLTEAALTDGFHQGPWSAAVASVEVDERRLDQLVAAPVDLVKIDVEGAEIETLRGMSGLLGARGVRAILVEWNPISMTASGHQPMDLPDFLAAAGYRAITVLDDETPAVELPLQAAIARFSAGGWSRRDFVNLVARPH
jgi:FkbM family methyltransferase